MLGGGLRMMLNRSVRCSRRPYRRGQSAGVSVELQGTIEVF